MRDFPELLIPAGSPEVLKVAVLYGADAVYIGGDVFSLRARAKNFTAEEMREGVLFAHAHGVRVYVTVNIFARNEDMEQLPDYLMELKDMGVDALIVSDPGVFMTVREILPEMEIHISTQANNTNYATVQFWKRQGAKRVVLARELSLKEIEEIRSQVSPDMELEAFVHGAMCISYSGRCLLSSFMTGRDANRGACTHPCRFKYALVEEKRPGQYFPIEEEENGTYILNSKDLCMIEHIPDLIRAGLDSLKVEGRMKNALYVAVVTGTYRRALDDLKESEEKYRAGIPSYLEEIKKCTVRDYTTGFFYGRPDESAQIYDTNTYEKNYTYLGLIGEEQRDGCFVTEQRNKFSVGEQIEVIAPDGGERAVFVKRILDEEGQEMESAPHPKQKLFVDVGEELHPFEILRRKEL